MMGRKVLIDARMDYALAALAFFGVIFWSFGSWFLLVWFLAPAYYRFRCVGPGIGANFSAVVPIPSNAVVLFADDPRNRFKIYSSQHDANVFSAPFLNVISVPRNFSPHNNRHDRGILAHEVGHVGRWDVLYLYILLIALLNSLFSYLRWVVYGYFYGFPGLSTTSVMHVIAGFIALFFAQQILHRREHVADVLTSGDGRLDLLGVLARRVRAAKRMKSSTGFGNFLDRISHPNAEKRLSVLKGEELYPLQQYFFYGLFWGFLALLYTHTNFLQRGFIIAGEVSDPGGIPWPLAVTCMAIVGGTVGWAALEMRQAFSPAQRAARFLGLYLGVMVWIVMLGQLHVWEDPTVNETPFWLYTCVLFGIVTFHVMISINRICASFIDRGNWIAVVGGIVAMGTTFLIVFGLFGLNVFDYTAYSYAIEHFGKARATAMFIAIFFLYAIGVSIISNLLMILGHLAVIKGSLLFRRSPQSG